MPIGDSLTVGLGGTEGANGYRNELLENLLLTGNWGTVGESGAIAQGGINTASARPLVDAWIAANRSGQSQDPDWVLIGLGNNDLAAIQSGSITQAAWLADMGHILDALHARFPLAQLLLWKSYQPLYESAQNLMDDTWIPLAISGRESFVAFGPDLRTILPGNVWPDNHPNPSGYSLIAAEWQTAMGY